MRTWTIRYKWASGTGVVYRANPPTDIHHAHEGVTTIRSPGTTEPTRTRIQRAIVADLTNADMHNPSFAWRIDQKVNMVGRA